MVRELMREGRSDLAAANQVHLEMAKWIMDEVHRITKERIELETEMKKFGGERANE